MITEMVILSISGLIVIIAVGFELYIARVIEKRDWERVSEVAKVYKECYERMIHPDTEWMDRFRKEHPDCSQKREMRK